MLKSARVSKSALTSFANTLTYMNNNKDEDFNIDFLDPQKLKESEEKLKDVVCNIADPSEGCESCSG